MSDTSKTYIKMCNCPEIQGQMKRDLKPSGFGWDYISNYEDWDSQYIAEDGETSLHCAGCNSEYGGRGLVAIAIWLPRQDQLQEMMGQGYGKCFALIEALWNWWTAPENPCGYCESLEQLWLAFVMKEKYNKTWDGEQWQ
ncbi:hypothetical protein LCGC14_0316910 [marine sediment metagenome]|uniref:Uncharacterized protein n=1 Tax=marine sediment metagenome TaxID=412755 RepID=A0A0F9TR31_9ZZZZ